MTCQVLQHLLRDLLDGVGRPLLLQPLPHRLAVAVLQRRLEDGRDPVLVVDCTVNKVGRDSDTHY